MQEYTRTHPGVQVQAGRIQRNHWKHIGLMTLLYGHISHLKGSGIEYYENRGC